MTNVLLINQQGNGTDYSYIHQSTEMFLPVKKAACFRIELGHLGEGGNPYTDFTQVISEEDIIEADDIKIQAYPMGSNKKICTELYKLPAIQSIFASKKVEPDSMIVYQVGGNGVVYDAFEQ